MIVVSRVLLSVTMSPPNEGLVNEEFNDEYMQV